MKIEPQENGLKHTFDILYVNGTPLHMTGSFKFDGKDYPVTGPNMDSLSAKRVDSNTFEYVIKNGGKIVQRSRDTVSKDGKTMTRRQTWTNGNGPEYTTIGVYDKQ